MSTRFQRVPRLLFVGALLVLLVTGLLPAAAQDEATFPLAGRGDYHASGQGFVFRDEHRAGRQVEVLLWYPGIVPEDQQERLPRLENFHLVLNDLEPDLSGAPYPLVLYSHGTGGSTNDLAAVMEPLVSHGFVVANIGHVNSPSAHNFIDRPYDALFAIHQLEAELAKSDSPLAGLIDFERIGVIGISGGAYTALRLSGVRVDTETASQFGDMVGLDLLRMFHPDWDWANMAAYQEQVAPVEADGMWPSTTDPRIRAVVAYLPCVAAFIGERGLATATVPTFLIAASADEVCGYDSAAAIFTQSGAPERDILTLVGAHHGLPDENLATVVRQFVTAYFGLHLQGKADYAEYLTEDYVSGIDGLLWGVDSSAVLDLSLIEARDFADGGTIVVGETSSGEITQVGSRTAYALSLDADSTLNIYVRATGPRTNDQSGLNFDSVLYVIDAQGKVLFWNDEVTRADDAQGVFDAGFEGLQLAEGNYSLVVGGYFVTGPYELIVESAAGN